MCLCTQLFYIINAVGMESLMPNEPWTQWVTPSVTKDFIVIVIIIIIMMSDQLNIGMIGFSETEPEEQFY